MLAAAGWRWAENSLEIRLREHISIRAMRRMRHVLTEVRDELGNWSRFKVIDPPLHAAKGGTDPALQKRHK